MLSTANFGHKFLECTLEPSDSNTDSVSLGGLSGAPFASGLPDSFTMLLGHDPKNREHDDREEQRCGCDGA